jgi:hypothetical protein
MPRQAQVTDIAKSQLLISTLGAIHAISNPIGFWQGVKGAFAFMGNRKGQLTPKLNEHIFTAIMASCSPEVVVTVKDHMGQRSKQVKAGIKAAGGPKNFDNFGAQGLAAFAGVKSVAMFDLTSLNPLSVAMNASTLQGYQNDYSLHRRTTTHLVNFAEQRIREIVNVEDA